MKKRNVIGIVMGCIAAFAMVSCEKKGPAEKAGEKIDESTEKAKDKMEEIGDDIEDATDK